MNTHFSLKLLARTAKLLALAAGLACAAGVQAQFTYTINNNTVTITGYTGPGGAVTIPDTISARPVTAIGDSAFLNNNHLTRVTMGRYVSSIGGFAFASCTNLTGVTMTNSVRIIGNQAFANCQSLTNVTLPDSVTNLGAVAFSGCSRLAGVATGSGLTSLGTATFSQCPRLTSVTLGTNVTALGGSAFKSCSALVTITIPARVGSLGDSAFNSCAALTGVYFQGNAPSVGLGVFDGDNLAVAYHLPGTTGWGLTFGGLPAVLWNAQIPVGDASFGVRTNRFGFTITGTRGLVLVVEASADLANPVWSSAGTNTLTDGAAYFSDPQWTNFPARFYRVRSP